MSISNPIVHSIFSLYNIHSPLHVHVHVFLHVLWRISAYLSINDLPLQDNGPFMIGYISPSLQVSKILDNKVTN